MSSKPMLPPTTHFAPAERAGRGQLHRELNAVARSPLVSTLLSSIGGVLAVLNEYRQVVALNEGFLKVLGLTDPRAVLGLRPGEAVRCIHADELPGGCGTSQTCASCGAVIAIMACLSRNAPQERTCVITTRQSGQRADLYFAVRCTPLWLGEKRFLLLFLQDVTAAQNWSESERVFLHDLNNLLSAYLASVELLARKGQTITGEYAQRLSALSVRLVDEIRVHQALVRGSLGDYRLRLEEVRLPAVVEELRTLAALHPDALGKQFKVAAPPPELSFVTDVSLMKRVLVNMLVNAFEATPQGGEVRCWADARDGAVVFHVWNAGQIPPEIVGRIFQRHFSTKGESGRGLGTFGMKLLGEQFLHGRVEFETSAEGGTTFHFRLPLAPDRPSADSSRHARTQ